VPLGSQLTDEVSREPRGAGYHSKHRLIDPEPGDRRPETRRNAGRHAAPSAGIGGRMNGRLAFRPLAVRD
jgi:hypothetical protein